MTVAGPSAAPAPAEAGPAGPPSGEVRRMFAAITPRYDLLNRILSLRQDRRWRAWAVRGAGDLPEGPVLDLCCGTGDLSAAARRLWPARAVVGADFCEEMLRRAARGDTGAPAPLVGADALRLPFRDGSFAAVLIGFGMRNWADRPAGLAEVARVLVPGGRLVGLEFTNDIAAWLRPFYTVYERVFLRPVGRWVSGSHAYGYLAGSIRTAPSRAQWVAWMEEAGFAGARGDLSFGGIVARLIGTWCGGGRG